MPPLGPPVSKKQSNAPTAAGKSRTINAANFDDIDDELENPY